MNWAFENEYIFYLKFGEIFETFCEKLKIAYPQFSEQEERFCYFLKLGLNTKKIATITKSSVKAIENKKYLIKKKLQPPDNETIYSVIQQL